MFFASKALQKFAAFGLKLIRAHCVTCTADEFRKFQQQLATSLHRRRHVKLSLVKFDNHLITPMLEIDTTSGIKALRTAWPHLDGFLIQRNRLVLRAHVLLADKPDAVKQKALLLLILSFLKRCSQASNQLIPIRQIRIAIIQGDQILPLMQFVKNICELLKSLPILWILL